jgi:hypothetical protein
MTKTLAILVTSALLCCGKTHAQEKPAAVELIDAQLSAWSVPDPNPWWVVADGVLTVTSDPKKTGNTLWTKEKFKDFTLEAESKFTGSVDSGFFLRDANEQIQIGDSGSLKRDMTGSPYIAKLKKYPIEATGVAALLKPGEWNSIRITAIGPHYTVVLNGTQVLDWKSETTITEGPIGVQLHPAKEMVTHFRNLKITRITR